jgi:hypothetical protein
MVLAVVVSLALGGAAGWVLNDVTPPAGVSSAEAVPPPNLLSNATSAAAEPEVPASPPERDEPRLRDLRGTFRLAVDRHPGYPENCRGFEEEGYGDIHVGQQVVVTDDAGRTVATGELTTCKFSPLESREQARGLLFRFVVRDVPEADFLKVQVGTGQRGQVTYSLQDLESSGWKVALSL